MPRHGLSRRAVLGGAAAVTTAGALSATSAAPAAAASGPSAASAFQRALPAVSGIKKRRRVVDYEVMELAALLRAGVVTSVQVTQAYLDRIDRFNGPFETYGDNGLYNAFIRIDRDGALAASAAADARFAKARKTREDLPRCSAYRSASRTPSPSKASRPRTAATPTTATRPCGMPRSSPGCARRAR